MAIGTILLIIVILLLLGAVPAWPHSRSWGYGPSGVLGVILVILLVLLLLGQSSGAFRPSMPGQKPGIFLPRSRGV